MSDRLYSLVEKLRQVDVVIDAQRRGALQCGTPLDAGALKAVAADMRGRLPGRRAACADDIARRIEAVKKHPVGRTDGRVDAMIGLAEEVVSKWPTIEQALEFYASHVEGGGR
jgi:hypothetical protein